MNAQELRLANLEMGLRLAQEKMLTDPSKRPEELLREVMCFMELLTNTEDKRRENNE